MTTEQQLSALHVQLSSLEVDLKQLLVVKPMAPEPNSHKHDVYVAKLAAIEKKLTVMEAAFDRLKGQGPAFHGSHDDAFAAKQRASSFQQLVDKVAVQMGLCLDHLAELCSPDHSKTVKGVVNLAKKLDEFLKMLHNAPQFKATIGHGDLKLVGPTPGGAPSPEALILPFVVAAIVLVRALQRAMGTGAGGK